MSSHRVLNMDADVLFSTKESSPYDLAVVQLKESFPGASVPQMATSFHPGFVKFLVLVKPSQVSVSTPFFIKKFPLNAGDPVVVKGYGGTGRRWGPSLTCGVLSKAVSLEHLPVMLQTTCAVQAGTSGGAVVHRHTGKLLGRGKNRTKNTFSTVGGTNRTPLDLDVCFAVCVHVFPILTSMFTCLLSAGIVSSNTKDIAAKVLYPHLNYSIPVSVFQAALQHYEKTKDTSVFRVLDMTEERVRRVWRLQVTQSKM